MVSNHWLVVWNHGILWLSIYWECHHPNWRTHIFQRGWHHQPDSFFKSVLGLDGFPHHPLKLIFFLGVFIHHQGHWLANGAPIMVCLLRGGYVALNHQTQVTCLREKAQNSTFFSTSPKYWMLKSHNFSEKSASFPFLILPLKPSHIYIYISYCCTYLNHICMMFS